MNGMVFLTKSLESSFSTDSAAALPYWGDETSHRGYLLDLGRSVGGTHFVAIDTDEMVVIGEGRAHDYRELRDAMLQMQPGDLFVMQVKSILLCNCFVITPHLL